MLAGLRNVIVWYCCRFIAIFSLRFVGRSYARRDILLYTYDMPFILPA